MCVSTGNAKVHYENILCFEMRRNIYCSICMSGGVMVVQARSEECVVGSRRDALRVTT